MQYQRIRTPEAWQELAAEWQQLFQQSHIRFPFIDLTFQESWWQTLGGGEWPADSSQLEIITGREDGVLTGIAPLFRSTKDGFPPALRFIGSIQVADYLDFIASADKLDAFLSGLLDYLASQPDLAKLPLDLVNLLDCSASPAALEKACASRGWTCTQEPIQPAPYIPLADSFEAYLAGISKKQRHEIRRKVRNAESRHATDWYFVQDPAQLPEDMDAFIKMMGKDPQKAAFLSPEMVQFLRLTAEAAFAEGKLHLAFLTMEERKVAAYFSLIFEKRLLVYNSAWEPAYAPCSPGWVLLAKIIAWAIEQGMSEVDMLRGDEHYKYKFGGIDRWVTRAICIPPQAS